MERSQAVATLAEVAGINLAYERVTLAPLIRFACVNGKDAHGIDRTLDAIELLIGGDAVAAVASPLGNRIYVNRDTGIILPLDGREPEDCPKIWVCKIGEAPPLDVPDGGDGPMRVAVEDEYKILTGHEPTFTFSGWGGDLTPVERAAL